MTLCSRMLIGHGQRLAVGCMRLSTAADRDEDRAAAVLRAAFEAGLTFLDTADAYCRDDRDVGHNERLIPGPSPAGPATARVFGWRPRAA